jgi:DNA polymerase-1
VPDGRLLLLDGHSLAYRAFYALPVENFSTSTGQPTNAVYGFTAMLINLLRDERPTHIAVAFDVSRRSFRTDRFPDYKATRSSAPETFAGQVDLLREVLTALGITSLALEGFEADDIIATLATEASHAGLDVLVVTGDRDTFQLVTPRVTVLYPRKGVSDLARMTPEAVREKYSVDPAQYADLAALRGDPSDNLPGIPGVGEKTAAKWIGEFGSLDALIDGVDRVGGKVGEALRGAVAQVLLNRELTSLVRDVPLPVGVDDLVRTQIDRDRVREVFDSLEFKVLRDRLLDTLPAVESPAPTASSDPLEFDAPADVAAWLMNHAAAGSTTAVACTGTWGRGTGELDRIALLSEAGRCAVIDLAAVPAGQRAALLDWWADRACEKVLHDAKGPSLALLATGTSLAGLRMDTALGAYLLAPGQRTDLIDVAERLLHVDLRTESGTAQLTLGESDEGAADLAAQARAVHLLAAREHVELSAQGAVSLLQEVELPLVAVLADMERIGIAVDQPGLRTLSADFAAEAARAQSDAHGIVGRPFNLGSPKQLQEILFAERGLPKTKKIKTGHTTDAEALTALFARTADPLLEAILRWRDWTRLAQTVDGLLPLATRDGRVHTTFNQMVAATGRLSSTDPNLQNIPIRTEAGRRIRTCFVVSDGFDCLLTADYSQIELRVMAHVSGDRALIDAFEAGEDLHTSMAAQVFGIDPVEVDAEKRRVIKAMSYGLAYGLSAYGLAQQLGTDTDEARRLMDDYFERFGGVREYLDSVVTRARATGYTETILGRRRYLPDLTSDNRQRREMAERMALNAPIQGSAADIIKCAMLRIHAALAEGGFRSRMLLQVHDELVLEVAPGELDRVRDLVVSGMSHAVPLDVPLGVQVGTGATWHAAGH